MTPDYSKRDYLLPDGCKDLIDALRLSAKEKASHAFIAWHAGQNAAKPVPLKGEILISEVVTVRGLADLLGQKPFRIIADAMELGVFANVKQCLGFDTASAIARKYGYAAKKLG